MNQPTREEFERLEAEQRQLKAEHDQPKEEVHKLREQQTEPMKITRLEIDSSSMHKLLVQANKKLEQIIQTQADPSERFDGIDRNHQELKRELYTISETWV